MSYQVLALKYRPQSFDEVVGQQHVTTTLANAIQQDRVAHAILFTGPRGTGKTTIARILAKAMNCKNGPSPTPCNTCKLCKSIIEGHCSDVFEIDGASNNSVDQIRDLRENVTYMPSSAAYKIYIIDEVHMLSTAAFNALLKTLEEPPEHVMFIFATTEVHKIPATILSRCQRHDLNRIPLDLISGHLQFLCSREEFNLENQSIDLIAQEADGSIRDALSLLDRILSSAKGRTIDHPSVLDGLGVLDRQILHDISAAIFNKDGAALIELIERVNDAGIDLKKYYADLILHFRNLNVIKICGKDSPAVNTTESEKEKIFQLTTRLPNDLLNTILQILLNQESLVKYSSHTKTAIEMVLLKLIQINPAAQIDQIIGKLDSLAKQIGTRPPGPAYQSRPLQDPGLETGVHEQVETPKIRPTVPEHQKSRAPIPGPEHPAPPIASHKQARSFTKNTWQEFLKEIERALPFMFALLSKGNMKEKDPGQICVELKNCSSFDKKRLDNKRQELQKTCKKMLNKDLFIHIVSEKNTSAQNDQKKKQRQARQAAFNHPLVLEAKKLFDGEIINQ